jgi:hypothetical protein
MSLSQIGAEFGRTPPFSMSSLYSAVSGIPASGAMSLSQFYGKSASVKTSNFTITIGTLRSNSDGKLVTEPNNIYGFSSNNTIGSISPTSAYRAYPITDIAYAAYDNGIRRLILTIGYAFAPQADGTVIPPTLAKRIVFSSGQSFTLPTTPSGSEPVIFYSWASPAVGCHNKTIFNSGSGHTKNLQYVVNLTAAPFPLSGTIGVTLEYD